MLYRVAQNPLDSRCLMYFPQCPLPFRHSVLKFLLLSNNSVAWSFNLDFLLMYYINIFDFYSVLVLTVNETFLGNWSFLIQGQIEHTEWYRFLLLLAYFQPGCVSWIIKVTKHLTHSNVEISVFCFMLFISQHRILTMSSWMSSDNNTSNAH